ncbi:MAG: DUF2490 domain-containing protein [Bacteroidaceae bacterium]|nr:DUF2490 domain-containing protein [Bacteroidaceae bacterium]
MKRIQILALMALLPLLAHAEDRYATWGEISIEKSLGLTKRWSIGATTEMRAEERDRWSIGADIGYKPIKYLKLGASYYFLYRHRPENRREHYRGDVVSDDNWNGYNLREAFWSPRHRANFEATGTVKLWKWLRISLRERYQFTHRMQSTAEDAKYRYTKMIDSATGTTTYTLRNGYPETETDTIATENDHILRSRLKLAVDKKGLAFGPFVSAELHNSLNSGQDFNLEKVRTAIGTEYKINKHNEISLAYVLTFQIHDDEAPYARLHDRLHALNISYSYKF